MSQGLVQDTELGVARPNVPGPLKPIGWRTEDGDLQSRRSGMRQKAGVALLLVGFAGAFRRSELIAVDWKDVEPSATGVVINIRRSKPTRRAAAERFPSREVARGSVPRSRGNG